MMGPEGQIALDILEIRKLLKQLVVINAYQSGMITLEEAYDRTGIKSEGWVYKNCKEKEPNFNDILREALDKEKQEPNFNDLLRSALDKQKEMSDDK